MNENNQPILVTGAHRSGTTWVGKMLAANGQSAYISEPLNVLHRPGVMITPIQHWYTYISPENEAQFLPGLRQTLAYHYHLFAELQSLRSTKDFLRMMRDATTFYKGRLLQQRPLLKDPFAVFSAPWFANRLNCKVVVVVRHPAAFASSLKRLNWSFDFSDLLSQPLLMKDWLEPFREELKSAINSDIIQQSSLLWNIIYRVVRHYQSAQESLPSGNKADIHIIRHEDLSLNPIDQFSRLYQDLGLKFNQKAEKTILQASSSANPGERSQKQASLSAPIYDVRLDSQANLSNWKRRLSAVEIAQIRELTAELASFYYPDFDWV